jgi:arsenate reductase
MTVTKILFLCTGNSCRSQMAEGWCRILKSDLYETASAGIVARGLDPLAVQVMKEVGVDIGRQTSKTLASQLAAGFKPDVVVTVCDHARENCPIFPGGLTKVVHVGFEDPPELAKTAATPEEALGHYRRVRNQIRDFVNRLPESPP